MKILFTILFIIFPYSAIHAQEDKAQLVNDLIADVMTISKADLNAASPIASVNKLATVQADKSIVLTKDNMEKSLEEAKDYKACLITVGDHTVVVVSDFDKRITSGSWKCKMPFGKGYVQKGTMNFKEDYLNNIIGVPDTQKRIMFLFK